MMRRISRTILLVLAFAATLFSCSKPKKQNKIRSVELVRWGAWSDHGAQLLIDSTLTYRYFDRNKKHSYIGLVSKSFWDTLNRKLEVINFQAPHPDPANSADCEIFTLIVHLKDREQKISEACNPNDSLSSIFIWLNNSYQRIKLRLVDSSFKFETDQIPPPPPPPEPGEKD